MIGAECKGSESSPAYESVESQVRRTFPHPLHELEGDGPCAERRA